MAYQALKASLGTKLIAMAGVGQTNKTIPVPWDVNVVMNHIRIHLYRKFWIGGFVASNSSATFMVTDISAGNCYGLVGLITLADPIVLRSDGCLTVSIYH
jgi:hypothetical protein